jgi:hypothetical protein
MKAEWKAAPKGWNDKKICRHCWYFRAEVENCGGKNCSQNGVKGYFTIQQIPKI